MSSPGNNFVSVEYDESSPGICGRIACHHEDFYEINGYDESFEGWGYEDVDFIKRLQTIDCTKRTVPPKSVIALGNSDEKRFLNYKNTSPEIISEASSFAGFRYVSNLQNFAKSRENILNGRSRANADRPWGEI
jgi:predicted glycosyltransferase involved in capsule biosynthesis